VPARPRAVLDHVELSAELQLECDDQKVDEIPFDFVRRRMSVVVSEQGDQHELICKGAQEEVLAVCTRVRDDSGRGALDLPLDAVMLERVQRVTRELSQDGLRVVALAMKEMPPAQTAYAVDDETDLTLLGYIAFLDPPKESAAPALQALAGHGVGVKVLTGDNELVTVHVCGQVGLAVDGVLLGPQVERMDDEALALAAERFRIFAKLTALHKERIVHAPRALGHIVGFMGDGINDAPALRASDIGTSVESAVDIVEKAADIILLEKSLMVLDDGVVEGSATFCNMLKYIRMTASSNFGNVLSVLVASVFLPFLPMLPLQLLVQNLLYDISQTGIPFDCVGAELVREPPRWNPADIGRFMLFFGPIISVFDITTFAVMWWMFKANSVAQQTLFQSGWFVVGLLTQTLIVHMIRTPKLPFVESRAAARLIATTAAIMLLGLWLPMGPLASYFKLQPLPLAYFAWLAGILLGYGVLTTPMKRNYVRRFGRQWPSRRDSRATRAARGAALGQTISGGVRRESPRIERQAQTRTGRVMAILPQGALAPGRTCEALSSARVPRASLAAMERQATFARLEHRPSRPTPASQIQVRRWGAHSRWRAFTWSHRQESNLYLALRRRPFYPLNYGGKCYRPEAIT
jgi:Mg2+-importing ATPase